MKLEEIYEMWAKDSALDETKVGEASYDISLLHARYGVMLSKLKLGLKQAQAERAKVYLDRYTFYTEGPSKEQMKAGAELPPRGKILKQEVDKYLEADDEMIRANLKLAIAQEKVDFLTDCMKQLANRQWQIKNYIDWQKFLNNG